MVQVPVGGVGQLQCSEADVISLIVDTEGLVSVLHQLVDREGGVVRLHLGVQDLDQQELQVWYKHYNEHLW